MCEVVQDLVVVGLRLGAGAAAVSEYQLLLSLVSQPQIRHIEVDLLQQATSALNVYPLLSLVASASFAAATSPTTSTLPLDSVPSAFLSSASRVCCFSLLLLPPASGANGGFR